MLSLFFLLLLRVCRIVAVIETCDPAIANYWCDYLIPTAMGGGYDYNGPGGSSNKPWVIGGNSVVDLAAGVYTPGTHNVLNAPTIFVVEQGQLRIKDLPYDQPVELRAHLVLCHHSTFVVQNATFRLGAQTDFSLLMLPQDYSTVYMSDAKAIAVSSDRPSDAAGHFGLWLFRSNSRLIIEPGPRGFGLRSGRAPDGNVLLSFNDAFEVSCADHAVCDVDHVEMLTESYIAGQANFTVRNSEFWDVFFAFCPEYLNDHAYQVGAHYVIPSFPVVCEPGTCLAGGSPYVDFQLAPPYTPFTYTSAHSRYFATVLSLYANSSAVIFPQVPGAQLGLGLDVRSVCPGGVCVTEFDVTLKVGKPATFTGFEELYHVRFTDPAATAFYSYQVWPQDRNNVRLHSGSSVGDMIPALGTVSAFNVTKDAMTYPHGSGAVMIYDSVVQGQIEAVDSGTLFLERCTILSTSMTAHHYGQITIADGSTPAGFQVHLNDQSIMRYFTLQSPVSGQQLAMSTDYDVYVAMYSVQGPSLTSIQEPSQLDIAQILCSSGSEALTVTTAVNRTIMAKSTVVNGLWGQFSPDSLGLPAGHYQLQVRWAESVGLFGNGSLAMSRRNVVFGTPGFAPPSCDCAQGLSAPPANGQMGTCGGWLQHKAACSVQCDTGYRVAYGKGQRECYHGSLRGPVQTCVPSECYQLLTAPAHGNVGTCGTWLTPGASCSIGCNTGYDIVGTPYTCTNGVLNGDQSCVDANGGGESNGAAVSAPRTAVLLVVALVLWQGNCNVWGRR